MEKNGPVRVSYEAKSKNPIDVGTFVFTVSVKLYISLHKYYENHSQAKISCIINAVVSYEMFM